MLSPPEIKLRAQKPLSRLGFSEEKQRMLEKCHMSDILEGVVSNDQGKDAVGELWIEEGTYRKWLRRKLLD